MAGDVSARIHGARLPLGTLEDGYRGHPEQIRLRHLRVQVGLVAMGEVGTHAGRPELADRAQALECEAGPNRADEDVDRRGGSEGREGGL